MSPGLLWWCLDPSSPFAKQGFYRWTLCADWTQGFERVPGSGSSGQARPQHLDLVVPVCTIWIWLYLSAPPSPDPESPGLPQKCHVVLYIHRVAEDVAFQGRRGLLEPEK